MRKSLTIIIPFLNEGNEVENTLESIRSNSDKNIEIIIINDASTDNCDYELIAEKYNARYVVNEKRMGVAASRDKGVSLCSTPYFLLLDAHMRFYDNLWVEKIILKLKQDERTILCCQTKMLGVENGCVVENQKSAVTYGAFVDFYTSNNLLGASWTHIEISDSSNLDVTPIACILGAGYACSKRYWQYLNGLEGLIFYGSDETYISLKVWLEGGKCLMLKRVVIGHIYRTQFPYSVEFLYTLYNRLLIAELLLPTFYKKKIFSTTKHQNLSMYNEAVFLLRENEKQIDRLKNYYTKILKGNFQDYLKLNNQAICHKNHLPQKKEILKQIAHYLLINNQSVTNIGIIEGRMSIVIFLFHYSKYIGQDLYYEFAENILDNLLSELHVGQSIWFLSGLSGIGWAIEYLYQNGFIEGNTNEILKEFDEKIMELDPLNVRDFSLNHGLGGIVLYLMARLYTIEHESKNNPFDQRFLRNIYCKIDFVINTKQDCDCIDIFIRFYRYYNKKEKMEQPSLYDIVCLPEYQMVNKYSVGLIYSAGVGLKLILDEEYL
jgi:glycosyltransferase involved in cell wall biosynthesis